MEPVYVHPEPSSDQFRTQFPIDESRIEELIPKLREMSEQDSEFDGFTYLGGNTLIIERACSNQERESFGGECFEQFPPFIDFFAWLEERSPRLVRCDIPNGEPHHSVKLSADEGFGFLMALSRDVEYCMANRPEAHNWPG